MAENKYLTKIAIGPLTLMGTAAASHLVQNLAMKKALHSKRLAGYLGKGFSEGLQGTTDSSWKETARRAFFGATLPEVNAMHSAAHAAGTKMAPVINGLSPKQKVGLKWLASGKIGKFKSKGFHKDPKILGAYGLAKTLYPGLQSAEHILRTGVEVSKSKNPILNNLLPGLAKGHSLRGTIQKPGRPTATAGIVGGLPMLVAEPGLGVLNTVKNVSQSQTAQKLPYVGAAIHKVENYAVMDPLKTGLKNPGKNYNRFRDKAEEILISPMSTNIKRLGSTLSTAGKNWYKKDTEL